MSCSCGDDHFKEPDVKDYKYCDRCGAELIIKEPTLAHRFNPVTGTGIYFRQVVCPKYHYPTNTAHLSTGYDIEKEREEKF